MAKAARKEMVSRTTGGQAGCRATAGIFEEHRGGKQRRGGRIRGGVGAEKRSGGRRPTGGFVILCADGN